ncbi:MAG: PfkB family carbohydrate kinase [Terracidiphilus sp.]
MTRGIFVGLSTIDLIHTVDEFPSANQKVVARSQAALVGGPASNAAITFSHLGGKATLVSAVGRHKLAALVKEELQHYGVSLVDLAPESEEPPPISSVWVNRQGQRSVVSVNSTHLKIPPAEIDPSILKNAHILLIDGHAMEACLAWAEAARSRGVPVVFDGGSWKPGTEQLLKFADTAICSADFLPPGCTGEGAVIEYLRANGVRQIAITRGANPIRFAAGSSLDSIDVPQVGVVDTSGAGDIFHGAFCYYSSIGFGFVEALRDAARIAAESCRFHGTREWMQGETRNSPLQTSN